MAAENLHIFVVAADGNRALDLPPQKQTVASWLRICTVFTTAVNPTV